MSEAVQDAVIEAQQEAGEPQVQVVQGGGAVNQQAQMQAQQEEQEAFNKRLAGLLQGKEAPPNEFVKYNLGLFKEAQGELDMIRNNLELAETQVEQMKARRTHLQGQLAQVIRAIREWDRPLTGGDHGAIQKQN